MAVQTAKREKSFSGQTITWFYTGDLDEMARFYGTALGLELVQDQGPCRIFRAAPNAFLDICDLPHRPLGTAGVILRS